MVDFLDLKEKIDLLTEIERDLGPGRRNGKWHLFHCPFPGHRRGDKVGSLGVTPYNGRYYCFGCGRSGDVITWLREYRQMDWKQIRELMGENVTNWSQTRRQTPRPEAEPLPDCPPSLFWQAKGIEFVEACERELRGENGKKALDYLHSRGLEDRTIQKYRLGYHRANDKRGTYEPFEDWGIDPDPDKKGVWIDRGIVIPWFVGNTLWSINIRRPSGEPKYRKIRGSRSALYGADNLRGAELVLFCEGEFDCMIADQVIGDIVGAATLGSASKQLDLLTWGAYLLSSRLVFVVYDTDEPGQAGAAKLAALGNRVKPLPLPGGNKDINDFTKSGGDLWSWIVGNLEQYDILPDGNTVFPWPEDKKEITVCWPADTDMSVISGLEDWRRAEDGSILLPSGGGLKWCLQPDGRFIAKYTREELALCKRAASCRK